MTRPSRAPAAARLVLLLGCGAAAGLLALSFVDLGDPGATARARMTAEANAEGQLVRTRWLELLARSEPLAPAVGLMELEAGALPVMAAPMAAADGEDEETSEDDRRLLAARIAAARSNADELARLTEPVVRRGGPRSGEALLALVRGLRRAGEPERAAAAHADLAAFVPWHAAVDGTSGRLLALLSAAGALDAATRRSEAEAFASALRAGEVALPTPADRATPTAKGWRVDADPWWSAIRREAEARLGDDGFDWIAAMLVHERARAAIAEAAPVGSGSAWRLRPIAAEASQEGATRAWVAARRDGDTLHVAIHTSEALDAAIASLALDSEDLVASAFVERADLPVVAEAGVLEGVDLALHVHHPDPDAVVRDERRRLAWLRGGLAALALLVLVATAAAARFIARTRALQELRSTFVASVSHDLRTPLASISLMAENLASGYARGNEERYVDSIRRETSRLGRLVDDLLDFGRIERGLRPRVTRAEVDVHAWLDAFEASERARCTAADCALSVERLDVPERATLDAAALERALGNLVGNALQHAEADAIRLRVRGDVHGLLTFEVEDAGQGLPRGVVHEHLFEPFRRAGEHGGTGLGLAIVRAIAEAHGGTATLAPGPDGSGTVATLRVRSAEEPAA
ncbi:MAG: HAMP domain-containing sensor histidine kinase [Planctomycetota bacterium]